jgi:hypothetical protein
MYDGNEKHVALEEKIPVHIVYFTAWPDGAGGVTTWPDVYGYGREAGGTGAGKRGAIASSTDATIFSYGRVGASRGGGYTESTPCSQASPSSRTRPLSYPRRREPRGVLVCGVRGDDRAARRRRRRRARVSWGVVQRRALAVGKARERHAAGLRTGTRGQCGALSAPAPSATSTRSPSSTIRARPPRSGSGCSTCMRAHSLRGAGGPWEGQRREHRHGVLERARDAPIEHRPLSHGGYLRGAEWLLAAAARIGPRLQRPRLRARHRHARRALCE